MIWYVFIIIIKNSIFVYIAYPRAVAPRSSWRRASRSDGCHHKGYVGVWRFALYFASYSNVIITFIFISLDFPIAAVSVVKYGLITAGIVAFCGPDEQSFENLSIFKISRRYGMYVGLVYSLLFECSPILCYVILFCWIQHNYKRSEATTSENKTKLQNYITKLHHTIKHKRQHKKATT
jgi:hypothetical protein